MQFAGLVGISCHSASLCEGVVGASQVLDLNMEQQFLGSCAESGEHVWCLVVTVRVLTVVESTRNATRRILCGDITTLKYL